MFIFRAVNIYPGQIDSVLSQLSGIACEYQIVLDRLSDGKDTMTIRIERAINESNSSDYQIISMIKEELKKKLLVTPEVEITDYGVLPRSDRKTKRVFDNRE